MEIKDIGRISNKLIEALDINFPNTIPSSPTAKEEIDMMIGQQQVIQRIKMWKDHIENPKEYSNVYT